MKTLSKFLGIAAIAGFTTAAGAVPVDRLVYKLTDNAMASGSVADADGSWLGMGGVNEGVAGANTLANNGIDYKDSWVDTNWASVTNVRVSMFDMGNEVAWMDFGAGTSKSDFFSKSNLSGSTWGAGAGVANPSFFFDIAGDTTNGRNWFVQNNYGGCNIDRGWMVVLEGGSDPCNWERTGKGALGDDNRGFLYSLVSNSHGNQNSFGTETGIADLFAVTVTYDDGNPSPVPVPASALLLLSGLGGVAVMRRRKTKKA